MARSKHKRGDLIRYGEGPTALMLVVAISKDHGRLGLYRYYGDQCCGGSVGAYESDVKPLRRGDKTAWKRWARFRAPARR